MTRLPRETYRLFSDAARYCSAHRLIAPGRLVVAGVSGGVDSMMLLEFLHWYTESVDFPLVVCHVNHGLRGDAADRDEALVRARCLEKKIPFEAVSAPVAALAREAGRGVEETGRAVRRAAFLEVGRRHAGEGPSGAAPAFDVALGHHMDDRAESILMHLGRGSGLAGLVGIRPRDGHFVRPFLSTRLDALIASAESLGVVWREDETNRSAAYLRNRVRQTLIPTWREVLGYDPVPQLVSLGDLAAGDEATLSSLAEKALRGARFPDRSLSITALLELERGLALRALRLFFEQETAAAGANDRPDESAEPAPESDWLKEIETDDNQTFSADHAAALLDLIGRVGRGERTEGALDLPAGWMAKAENGRLFLCRKKNR